MESAGTSSVPVAVVALGPATKPSARGAMTWLAAAELAVGLARGMGSLAS